MCKINIICDENKKSKKIHSILLKKFKRQNFIRNNLIIVIGGDGFMLKTLKKTEIQINIFMVLILETMVF